MAKWILRFLVNWASSVLSGLVQSPTFLVIVSIHLIIDGVAPNKYRKCFIVGFIYAYIV